MTQFVIWILMLYGMTNIAVYGSILNGFRNHIEKLGNNPKIMLSNLFHFIREMMRCMMCASFHLGYLVSIFVYSPTHQNLGLNTYTSWFFDACLASGGVWIINSIVEWFEENRPNNNNN